MNTYIIGAGVLVLILTGAGLGLFFALESDDDEFTTEIPETTQLPTTSIPTTEFALPEPTLPENFLLISECPYNPTCRDALNFNYYNVTTPTPIETNKTICQCFPELNTFSIGNYVQQITYNPELSGFEYAYGEQIHGYIDQKTGNIGQLQNLVKCPVHAALVYHENVGSLLIGGLDFYINGETDWMKVNSTKSNRRVEQIYKPNSWVEEAGFVFPQMKHSRFNHKAQVYKNSIYVTGGQNYNIFYIVAEMEVLNVNNLKKLEWVTLKALEEPRHMHNVQIFNGLIYNFGGYNDTGISKSIEIYDINTHESVLNGDMMHPRCNSASFFSESVETSVGNPVNSAPKFRSKVYPDAELIKNGKWNIESKLTLTVLGGYNTYPPYVNEHGNPDSEEFFGIMTDSLPNLLNKNTAFVNF